MISSGFYFSKSSAKYVVSKLWHEISQLETISAANSSEQTCTCAMLRQQRDESDRQPRLELDTRVEVLELSQLTTMTGSIKECQCAN